MGYNIHHNLDFLRTTHQSSSPVPTTNVMRTCNCSHNKNSYNSSLIHPCVCTKLKTSYLSLCTWKLLGVKFTKKGETGTLTHPFPPFWPLWSPLIEPSQHQSILPQSSSDLLPPEQDKMCYLLGTQKSLSQILGHIQQTGCNTPIVTIFL